MRRLAHAPDALHEEVSADYTDTIHAETAKDVQSRRRAFLRKWRLRCPAVAVSLEEADVKKSGLSLTDGVCWPQQRIPP